MGNIASRSTPPRNAATSNVATVSLLAVATLVVACKGGVDLPVFASDIAYDTVAVVGRADEDRPLLVYGSPFPKLVDDSTVAYSDADDRGRMVVVSMLTGSGWEVSSGPGEEGPGQFGGAQPFVVPQDGVIHTATMHGQVYNGWTRDGTLLSSVRYVEPWMAGTGSTFILGLVGRRAVVTYTESPDWSGSSDQLLRRGIRIYDPELGLVADVSAGIPPVQVRLPPERGSDGYSTVEGAGLIVAARGETIVWGLNGERTVTVLDSAGDFVASRNLDAPLAALFVDLNGRIWAGTTARDIDGILIKYVLSRDLRVLFRAAVKHVVDASGEYMLALEFDQRLGVIPMVLLKMEERP